MSFIFFILFAGSAAETTSLIFRFNAANAAIFPVQRRYFSGSTPLFFRLNAVNAAIFPVKRRHFSG